jgi:hypothetical protein
MFSKNDITLFNFKLCKKISKGDFHFFICFLFLGLRARLNGIKYHFFILFSKIKFFVFKVFFVLAKFLMGMDRKE